MTNKMFKDFVNLYNHEGKYKNIGTVIEVNKDYLADAELKKILENKKVDTGMIQLQKFYGG